MFKIQFYVDDKNLGEAFKRLAGIARGVEHVYVPNVEDKPGPVRANGDFVEHFMKEVKKRKLHELKAPEVKSIISGMGMPISSYSHHLLKVIEAGHLTRKKATKGTGMIYTVKG